MSAQRAAADLHADVRRCEGDEDAALWRQAGEMMWAHAADCIVQVPIVHTRVPALDAILREAGARARYGLAGNIAWVAWAGQQPLARLDEVLTELDLAGTVLVGPAGRPLLGAARGGSFAARVRGAIDPHRRFPEA